MNYRLDDINVGYQRLGWSGNPFALEENGISPVDPPERWQPSLVSGDPAILVFQPGFGQSIALRKWLGYHFNKKHKNGEKDCRLVVLIEISEPNLVLPHIARIIAEFLIVFLNGNRSLLDSATPERRNAIARVITACYPEDGDFEEILLRHGISGNEEQRMFVEMIRRTWGTVQPIESQSEDDILTSLRNALPSGYSGLTLTVDVRRDQISSDHRLPPQANSLLQLMSRLTKSANAAVKLGVPHDVVFAPLEFNMTVMCPWNEDDLRVLLCSRLRAVQGTLKGSSSSLELIRGMDLGVKIEEFLVKNALGSPKRLMDLGSRLLETYGARARREASPGIPCIDQADLNRLLNDNFFPTMLEELRTWHRTKEEVRDLCMYMNLSYCNLGGKGPRGKLRGLLISLKTREELDRLIQHCQKEHPSGKWPRLPWDY